MQYGQYLIDLVENPPGHWSAHVRRKDQKLIWTQTGSKAVPEVLTSVFLREEEAETEAKRSIDGRLME